MKGLITSALVVGAMFVGGVYLGRGPRVIADQETRKLAQDQARLAEVEAAHSKLMRRESELRSPTGYEKYVRSRGYVRANEVAAPPVPVESASPAPAPSPSPN